jgi:hypothetical protein
MPHPIRVPLVGRDRELATPIGAVDATRSGRGHLYLHEGLAAALGLGGRVRRAGSPAERARVRVTRALREAIERIRAADARLGEHLARSIRTGTYCCYAPAGPTVWTVARADRAEATF